MEMGSERKKVEIQIAPGVKIGVSPPPQINAQKGIPSELMPDLRIRAIGPKRNGRPVTTTHKPQPFSN